MSLFPTILTSDNPLTLPAWFKDLTGIEKQDFKGTLQVKLFSSSLRLAKSFLVEFHAEILKNQFDLVDIFRRELNLIDESWNDRSKITGDIIELTVDANPPYDLRFKCVNLTNLMVKY